MRTITPNRLPVTEYKDILFGSSDGRSLELEYEVEEWCKANLKGNIYIGFGAAVATLTAPLLYWFDFQSSEDKNSFIDRWIKEQ